MTFGFEREQRGSHLPPPHARFVSGHGSQSLLKRSLVSGHGFSHADQKPRSRAPLSKPAEKKPRSRWLSAMPAKSLVSGHGFSHAGPAGLKKRLQALCLTQRFSRCRALASRRGGLLL